jgi:hypothetical protein
MDLGPQFNSRTLKGDVSIKNTLPEQEELGGRARHTYTDKDGWYHNKPPKDLDVDKQWEEVKVAWKGDRAAYDRYVGKA